MYVVSGGPSSYRFAFDIQESWRFLRLRSPLRSHFPKSKLADSMNTRHKRQKAGHLLERRHYGPLAVVSFWEHERARAIEDLQEMINGV
jgi:hypothetical protein